MLDLGLSASDLAKYNSALLNDSRPVRARLYLYDRDENLIGEIGSPSDEDGPAIVEGSVSVDEEAEITREAQLTLLDDDYQIGFDPSAPADYVIYFDRSIQVVREDYISDLARWVACPLFFGPITAFNREGPLVNITALGKEMRLLDPEVVWDNVRINKGVLVTDALRTLLGLHGETKFDFPELDARLQNPVDLARSGEVRITKIKKGKKGKRKIKVEKQVEDEPWVVARDLAARTGHLLFYDGRGRARLKPHVPNPSWTFQTGEGGGSLSRPELGFDLAEVRNVIEVLGEPPRGKWARVRAVASPHPSHPLSPESLARNGKVRRLIERIEDNKVSTPAQAEQRARDELSKSLEAAMSISLDYLPVPHFEEGDRAILHEPHRIWLEFRPRRFTIPVGATGAMSVGEIAQPVTPGDRIKSIRRGRRRKKKKGKRR